MTSPNNLSTELCFSYILMRNRDGNSNLKTSVAGNGDHADLAADILNDSVDDIETQARAFTDPFGGEERVKDARFYVGRNTGSIVRDFDKHGIVFSPRADAERAAALHGVDSVIYEIGPDLIQFAANGHDLGKVGSIIADDGDAPLELVIHDGEGGLEAVLEIDFLEGALIHKGIFLNGFDEIRYARRAVLELIGNAVQFKESSEAGQFRAERCTSCGGKAFQVSIGEIGVNQEGCDLPSLRHVARFEPRLDRFFTLDAGELVLELNWFQIGSDFLFASGQLSTVIRTDRRTASGRAEAGEAIAQSGSGPASSGGGIVELMCKAGGEFAECGKLLVLLFCAGHIANAVREQTDETAYEFRQSLEEFGELSDGKVEDMRGRNCPPSHSEHFHAGEGKHAGDVAGSDRVYRPIGATVFSSSAKFTF